MKFLEQYRQLVCYGLAEHNGKLWFYNFNFGAIVEMDMRDMVPHIIWMAEGKDFYLWNQYGDVKWYENRLIFAPRSADHILIFDLMTHETMRIPYDGNRIQNGNKENQFLSVVVSGDNAYFFPGRYRAILRLNLKNYQIAYFDEWVREMGDNENPDSVTFSHARMTGCNICMLPAWQQGKILAFDFGQECSCIYDIGTEALSDIVFDGTTYWISLRNHSSIVRWQPEKNEIERSGRLDADMLFQEGFRFVLDGGEFIYLVPQRGKGIIGVHKDTEENVLLAELSTHITDVLENLNRVKTNAFSCTKVSQDVYIIFDAFAGDFVWVDVREKEVKRYPAKLNEDEWSRFKPKVYEELWRNPVQECSGLGIRELIFSLDDMGAFGDKRLRK